MADAQALRRNIETELASARERRDEAQCRISNDQRVVDLAQAAIDAYEYTLRLLSDAPKRGRPTTNGAAPARKPRKVKPALGLTLTDLTDQPQV